MKIQNALVIGASGGIGRAVADALEASSASVVRLSRSGDGLDITREGSVQTCLSAIEGAFDLIFVATGALEIDGHAPEKTLKSVNAEAMARQFAVNAIGPALVLKHSQSLIPRDRRAVFAVLSARVGSIGDNGLGGWYSYRAAKAAVNQIVHTAAIEMRRTHPHSICAALHPGTVETAFTRDYLGRHPAVTPPVAAANLLSVVDGLTTDQSGGFFDWAGKEVPW